MNECKWCGNPLMLETHHIIPRFIGGNNDPANLMLLCRNCHDIADYWNYLDLERFQSRRYNCQADKGV
jgi:5-methylcytosine-specific restriction endonuclease McrA